MANERNAQALREARESVQVYEALLSAARAVRFTYAQDHQALTRQIAELTARRSELERAFLEAPDKIAEYEPKLAAAKASVERLLNADSRPAGNYRGGGRRSETPLEKLMRLREELRRAEEECGGGPHA